MGSRIKQQPRRVKKKPKRSAFSRFYRFLVILSAFIVVGFCIYQYMAVLPDLPLFPEETGALPALPGADDGSADAFVPSNPSPSGPRQRKDGVYNFLLCGTDHNNGGTDTIIVVQYDTVNQEVHMVSVPRDTMILNSSGKIRKINSSYNNGGVDQLKTELRKLLGVPIDYYIKVDLNGFVAGIDALGGVDFEVPVNMNYDDPTPGQELHIHFNRGMTHLSGSDAIKVVRYRHDNDSSVNAGYNDQQRMETQQALIKAVVAKVLANPLKVPELVGIVMDHVETDLSAKNMTAFANQVLTRLDMENISSDTLPGNYAAQYGGGWYVALYPQEVVDMVNQRLNPYQRELTLDDVTITTLDGNKKPYTV